MNTPQFDLSAMLSTPQQTAVQQIPCDQLKPYHNHKFELYSGERLEDMVASIKENGVLSPIIVQPDGDGYEILIGHNRWNASKLAGMPTVPAIIKAGLTEDEAEMYVIESNVMQRGFENLKISEQAAAVALRHSEMFSQGKRNDILRELAHLENPSAEPDSSTLNPVGSKLDTSESIGNEYGVSNPVLGAYLKEVPILIKGSDALKETLCHRRKTLSANGLKIHFENSTFTKDVLLKEIYHNGAIVCLYRLETAQGETAGFYNTQTKQFVSMFTHTEEQTTLLGNYVENTILWCYAAFVGSDTSIIPTAESYNDYLRDQTAEITFTSIGGKLRVPTETKHIRTIAGDDRYEPEIKHISGYIRKLPDGQKASERAVTLAQSLGYDLAENETYVQPFERSSWIINKKR